MGWEKRTSIQNSLNSLLLTPGRVFRYHMAAFPTATIVNLGYTIEGHQWLIEGVRGSFCCPY